MNKFSNAKISTLHYCYVLQMGEENIKAATEDYKQNSKTFTEKWRKKIQSSELLQIVET